MLLWEQHVPTLAASGWRAVIRSFAARSIETRVDKGLQRGCCSVRWGGENAVKEARITSRGRIGSHVCARTALFVVEEEREGEAEVVVVVVVVGRRRPRLSANEERNGSSKRTARRQRQTCLPACLPKPKRMHLPTHTRTQGEQAGRTAQPLEPTARLRGGLARLFQVIQTQN